MAASATCVWYSRAAATASTRYSWKHFGDAAADADGVEPERAEERQARPLEAPVARVPRAAERHNNNNEAVGREPVPPLPSRFVLSTHPRPHAGLAVAHDCCSLVRAAWQQCCVGSCGQAPELLMLVQLGALQCNSIEMFLRVYMLLQACKLVQRWQLASVVRILAKRITTASAA